MLLDGAGAVEVVPEPELILTDEDALPKEDVVSEWVLVLVVELCADTSMIELMTTMRDLKEYIARILEKKVG